MTLRDVLKKIANGEKLSKDEIEIFISIADKLDYPEPKGGERKNKKDEPKNDS